MKQMINLLNTFLDLTSYGGSNRNGMEVAAISNGLQSLQCLEDQQLHKIG